MTPGIPQNYPLQKCFSSCDSCNFLLFYFLGNLNIFPCKVSGCISEEETLLPKIYLGEQEVRRGVLIANASSASKQKWNAGRKTQLIITREDQSVLIDHAEKIVMMQR